ncbi:MAG: hypothetical protein HYV63_32265, partial [Candidatus Schekmanbacteria bacterium]|nr:hypothetical protein [Candidatus Schekmanbacteria bacterium]
AVTTDGTGKIAVSGTVSDTELGYLDGVTSAIQGQLDAKQATITGSATTIDTETLAVSSAVTTDGTGKIAVSGTVSDTELGYLDGVTSAIQGQLDTHTADSAAHSATDANTASTIVRRDGSGNFAAGTISASTYDATGAAPIQIGSADVTSVTIVTDTTGDGEVGLPENSIGPDELGATQGEIIFCGNLSNNSDPPVAGTNYLGPATSIFNGAYGDWSLSSVNCDGLDNATESTADALVMTNVGFKVTGMYCKLSSAGANGVTFTLRSAEASTTPVISCTVATGDTDCRSLSASTTDIAAGATIAVQAVDSEDLSLEGGWCRVFYALK